MNSDFLPETKKKKKEKTTEQVDILFLRLFVNRLQTSETECGKIF